MVEKDVIARLIKENRLSTLDLEQLLALSVDDIIQNLVGLKGGFVYRAYLVERLMELTDGPRGIAVPDNVYNEATLTKCRSNEPSVIFNED